MSDELVSQQGGRIKSYKCRPGSNDHANTECFLMWVDVGNRKKRFFNGSDEEVWLVVDIQQIKCAAKYTINIFGEISDVENAIKCLDVNTICGMDGIYAEYLKHCDEHIVPILAMYVTGVLCLYRDSLLSVVLVPIIKDKFGNINNKDNYGLIALASLVLRNC